MIIRWIKTNWKDLFVGIFLVVFVAVPLLWGLTDWDHYGKTVGHVYYLYRTNFRDFVDAALG